ncbi:Arginase-1 [Pseudolycoriella hygida]|uniref:Arginase n=1 Tax=Pseudolycoriella hygida TaxID=35572 RepID=A0A9Q0MQX5_9DIPT|nr:Arginase-1 [Pseudolycoriella hygida]
MGIDGVIKHVAKMSSVPNKRIGIIGCPFSKGQQKRGPELAPQESLDVLDYGDVDIAHRKYTPSYPRNMRNYGQIVGTVVNLASKVEEILKDDRMVVTLGGDHSVAIGSIGAHLMHNKDIAVIWVDAHADINTSLTSVSGNIHGMTVAVLAKELESYWPQLPGMEWLKNKLSLKDIVYIGLRSIDPLEKLIMSKFNVHAYGMEDIDRYGIYDIVQNALQYVDPEKKKSYHVSYDIDSLDGLEAPSTGTRGYEEVSISFGITSSKLVISVRGGLSLREGICILEEIYDTGRLAAVDLVELNPAIGSEDDVSKTVDAAIQILKAACGTVRKGVLPNDAVIPKP